jgi:hypothetical protein
MFKGQKGVTLVALVVTIIVLLILAGVSISMVVGQNGILTRTRGPVNNQNAASAREKLTMACSATEMAFQQEWAANQSLTRGDYYYDANGGVAKELTNNGCTDVSIPTSGFVVAQDSYDSAAGVTITFKVNGTLYTFSNVKVNAQTGGIGMSKAVVVGTGTDAATVNLAD